jgi:IS5 family transposase
MLTAFIVMVFKGFSERELETFLRNYPFWSRLCGFKGKSPCHAIFSNFKRRIGEDVLKKVMEDLVQSLVEAGAIPLSKVALDSSALSTILKDQEANWGHTHDGPFYGYKIHIACCADSELPVSILVTPGNIHDSTECLNLMKGARKYRKKITYMIADTAYDARLWHTEALFLHNSLLKKGLQVQDSNRKGEQHCDKRTWTGQPEV